jgi:hypothetical protein
VPGPAIEKQRPYRSAGKAARCIKPCKPKKHQTRTAQAWSYGRMSSMASHMVSLRFIPDPRLQDQLICLVQ